MFIDFQKLIDRTNLELHWERIRDRLDQIHFGRRKTSLYQFLRFFIIHFAKDDILVRAKAVAYNFTLAIFPGIIFLFTLIPYFPIPGMRDSVMNFLNEIDLSMIAQVKTTIDDILSTPRGGLLSIGAFVTLYLTTNGVMALVTTFNKFYKTTYSRGFIVDYLVAMVLTIMLMLVLTLSMGLLIGGEIALNYMTKIGFLTDKIVVLLLFASRFMALFIIFLIMVSLIYYFGPSVEDRWRFFNPGSIIATFLIIGISYGFSFYLSNFANYNKIYGSIGAIIAFMVWLYFISVILLIGFEINASIDRANHEEYVN
ncbi:MAG TPA: YihY/virulence factor BrkB family protein [Cyclobacteriaceae bacterium]|nr:YihY/virulence factor BrkB family protein [Cyclobacteriaceae bacterium]